MRLARGFGVAAHTCCRELGATRSSAAGKRRSHDGSAPGGTLQFEPATEGLDAVGEPAQAGAAVDARAAASVVTDLDDDFCIRSCNRDPRFGRVGVLGRVRQALGDDVVDSRFDPFVETQRRDAGDLDREGRAVPE